MFAEWVVYNCSAGCNMQGLTWQDSHQELLPQVVQLRPAAHQRCVGQAQHHLQTGLVVQAVAEDVAAVALVFGLWG
jgi:hypothetical protein